MTIANSDPPENVYVICPYCGTRQRTRLERMTRPQIVLCDCEDYPGCDRWFAVRLQMVPRLQYYAVDETPEAENQTEQRKAEAILEAS